MLSVVVDPWLLLVGVAAIAAAWLYTGGPKPYGYLGLGEIMVLVFFGFVATVGSAYVQVEYVPGAAWWGSLVVGLLACAILVANNVRDIPTDAVTGKRTLAVRVGATAARRLFVACYVGSFAAVVAIGITQHPRALLGPARAPARGRAGAHDPHPHRSAVARLGAGRDVEARGGRGGAGERGPVSLLTEHRLRIGDRAVTLLEGPAGWGEYSPLPGYPSDPDACRAAAEEAAQVGFPPAVRDTVPCNALVDGPFAVADVRAYPAVKVKVRDASGISLVAAVRDAVGAHVGVRVDANGAWDVDTAVTMIGRLARYDLEYVEQPVATLDDLARVRRRVTVPVAADECIRTRDDAARLQVLDAADVIVLKQQPLGGLRAALEIAAIAGVPAVVSSMMETSVGIAAGLALAAALPELPYACGLATLSALAGDVTSHPLVPVDGVLRVRTVAPDPERLARYQESSR